MPAYHPVNVGYEHTWHLAHRRHVRLRADVTNLFDEVYELRDGSGIGVEAPQYGACRGVLFGASYDF